MAEIKIYGTLVNDTNEAIVKSTQVAAVKQDGTAATQSAVNADLYAKYAAVGNAYRVKGTKATIAEVTALTTKAIGDVWNVTAEFTLNSKVYPAGTNVVWTGSEWDPLGGTVDLWSVEQQIPDEMEIAGEKNGVTISLWHDRGFLFQGVILPATPSAAGVLSPSDKSKLDGIAAGAQVNVIESVKVNGTALGVSGKSVNIDLSPYAKSADTIHVADVTATATDMNLKMRKAAGETPICNVIFNAATTSAAGIMSSTDKSKLNAIAAGAQVNVIESVKVNGTALGVSGKSVNIDLSPYAKSADTIHVADVTASETNMNLKLRKKANDTPICNVVFNAATTSTAGLMSAADKTRLEASATAADLNAAKALITALTNRVAALEAALTLK